MRSWKAIWASRRFDVDFFPRRPPSKLAAAVPAAIQPAIRVFQHVVGELGELVQAGAEIRISDIAGMKEPAGEAGEVEVPFGHGVLLRLKG